MDFIDIFHDIAVALKAVGAVSYQYILELIGGLLAIILLSMKIYAFGRDRVLKQLKPFMLGEDGFWDKRPQRNVARHIEILRTGIPILTIANFKGGVGLSYPLILDDSESLGKRAVFA